MNITYPVRPLLPVKQPKTAAFSGHRQQNVSRALANTLTALSNGVPQSYVLPGLHFGMRPDDTLPDSVRQKVDALASEFDFELDPFQKKGIRILVEGRSPVVTATTSSGKTVIAEAAMSEVLKNRKKLFYTAPRKAISNEKYKELCDKYGAANVGIMTGDITVNPSASIVLMTTEIFRNMLYRPEENQSRFRDLQYVVFDECHFISDPDRGMVWEESALFARRELPNVQQIHLSATVGNAEEYTGWLNSLNTSGAKAGEFEVVSHPHRPVPLTVQYMTPSGNLVDVLGPDREPSLAFHNAFSEAVRDKKQNGFMPVRTVQSLQRAGKLPLIEFVFGRNRCEAYANRVLQAAQDGRLRLTSDREKQSIQMVIDAYVKAYPSLRGSELFSYLREGIAYHHAGMWSREKEMVEVLLKKNLLKVVFATSTLAEGVNVPARTVGLSALEIRKPTGMEPVSASEFQQMTGRAGRRGMFPRGYAVLAHPSDNDKQRIIRLVQAGPNDLKSQLRLTPYGTLALIERLQDRSRIGALLQNSYRSFQLQRERSVSRGRGRHHKRAHGHNRQRNYEQRDLVAGFDAMRQFLVTAGYVNQDNKLTVLGKTASRIPVESGLLIAQALASGILNDLTPSELAAILSASVSARPSAAQERKRDIGESTGDLKLANKLRTLDKMNRKLEGQADARGVSFESGLNAGDVDVVRKWCLVHDDALLDDSPGILSYTILRTANLLLHITEMPKVAPKLKSTAERARAMLLSGAIEEQIRPGRVKID
jgi:superfamily II RNA helicase